MGTRFGMNITGERLDAALRDLEERLPGGVMRRGSDGWQSARTVFAPRGRLRQPLAAVRPANRDEVAKVLAWASADGVPVSPRSGGHSFDGFSCRDDTLMMDLRSLKHSSLGSDGRLYATPATTNMDIAKVLGPARRMLPVGDCPTVALGGLATGGGFGYAGRLFGLTIDHLVEATVALGDGSLVRAAGDENPELFWALRGGGGAAGIVTDLVFETVEVPIITIFSIGWSWAEVREAFRLYADLIAAGPRTLDLKLKIRTTGADRFIDMATAGPPGFEPGWPSVHLDGNFIGPRHDAEEVLAPLLGHPAALSQSVSERSFDEAEAALVPVGTLAEAAPATARPMRVASDFCIGGIGDHGAEAIIAFAEALQNDPDLGGGGVIVEPSGGRITELPVDAMAFPHRNTDILLEWEIFGGLANSPAINARHDELLATLRAGLAERVTGGRYLNYADRLDTPTDWWGSNLPRLRAIAASADPRGVIASRLNPLRAPS
jgi:FAD/FMN-containing dehydrogenase